MAPHSLFATVAVEHTTRGVVVLLRLGGLVLVSALLRFLVPGMLTGPGLRRVFLQRPVVAAVDTISR